LGTRYRLYVRVGQRDMVFDLDPKTVVVKNKANGALEWHCGALKPEPLTVVYDPSKKSAKTVGTIRELIF
jgi:hypothetical protein